MTPRPRRLALAALLAPLLLGSPAFSAAASDAATRAEQLDAEAHLGAPTSILGRSYPGAHAELARLGYQPVRLERSASDCAQDALIFHMGDSDRALAAAQRQAARRCAKWPEVVSCYDVADVCFYYWRRPSDGRLLIVEAFEDAAVVDAWWARDDDVCDQKLPASLPLTRLPASRADACS